MNKRKKIILSLLLLAFAFILLIGGINVYILHFSKKYIITTDQATPTTQAILILGARVYQNGALSDILRDRTDTAIELYKAGKAPVFLISGDHGTKDYDEVDAVKNYLLKEGIPAQSIFLDHAGFDTFDSLYRAKAIFGVESLIVTTQNFHLPRTVFVGNKLGITTYGVSADKQHYVDSSRNELREVLARTKAFFNIFFKSQPKFLGEKIPITGDAQKSWG
jgi:vancomycin permeability regulator SanA